jgi:nitroreductase
MSQDLNLPEEIAQHRIADYDIDPIFLKRWSPRAFSPEPIDEETLMRVFECARWAASSFNEQPWRFLIARSEEDRQKFLSFLMPANQVWAKNAPVLVLVISKKTFSHNGSPNKVYMHDAGAAAAYMALGATMNGLIAHGMAGYDADQARATLGIPTDFDPVSVWALGKHGDKSTLPPEVAEREVPSGRRPVAESIMEGHFVQAAEEAAEEDTENDGT